MPKNAPSFAISVRVKHKHRSSYNNQRRHDLRIGRQPKYVAKDRSQLNRTLVDLPSPAAISKTALSLRAKTDVQRGMRDDAAVATVGIITFGVAAQPIFNALTPDQQDSAYLEIAQEIAKDCGTTLRGLVVHADETAPHAHFVMDTRDGAGVPMSRIMKGSRLQDIAATVIAKHAPGIVRGELKKARQKRGDDPSAIYNRSVKQLHDDLPREIAEREAELDRLEARVNEMSAKVSQLEDRESLNEKEKKRLDTYRKRLVERVREYEAAVETQKQAISMKERTLDAAKSELDLREIQLEERAAFLEERTKILDERQIHLSRREIKLQSVYKKVEALVGEVSERLGVGNTLREISEAIKSYFSGQDFKKNDDERFEL